MIDNIEELTEKIRKYALMAVSHSRYEHSVRTAETCAKLCRKFGLDEKIGYLAGISHDMCKALSPELLFSIASRDGNPISELEIERKGLLHGRAAAVKLQEDFAVSDQELLEAVANHTFGKVGMCDLSKILFVADKIEPGRPHVTEEYMKKIKKLTLDELAYRIIKENVDYLAEKGKTVAPQSITVLNWLKQFVEGEIAKS